MGKRERETTKTPIVRAVRIRNSLTFSQHPPALTHFLSILVGHLAHTASHSLSIVGGKQRGLSAMPLSARWGLPSAEGPSLDRSRSSSKLRESAASAVPTAVTAVMQWNAA